MSDVARDAGVSTATVSRVLNGSADVSEALRLKVLKTVDNLGYVRDSTARALAMKRSFLVGMVMPEAPDALCAEILSAFETSVGASGFGTLVVQTPGGGEALRRSLRHLLEHGVEGALVLGPTDDAELTALAASHDVALVSIAGASGQPGSLSIDLGIELAAARLAAHVHGLAHRRIGLVTGSLRSSCLAGEFVRGIRQQLADFEAPAPLLFETRDSPESGAHALGEFLALASPPTAVLCASGELAVGVLSEAQRRGLSVPGHLSVSAITTPAFARTLYPALSGIELDASEIGRLAAGTLVTRIGQHSRTQTLNLAAAVTLRESLAPPFTDGSAPIA